MQLGAVVTEKEVGLLAALRLMGLRQSAYWSSWVAADLLLGLATALSIVIWGERRRGHTLVLQVLLGVVLHLTAPALAMCMVLHCCSHDWLRVLSLTPSLLL